jgi:hypothetical protein
MDVGAKQGESAPLALKVFDDDGRDVVRAAEAASDFTGPATGESTGDVAGEFTRDSGSCRYI